ncbi:TIR domain-containing protein [Saccharopolyspora phatthalungensis]|uniref:TIR domain-containing protein n=1 Tax=Saccharopolyspora phatthalungensis TaxID=664693 RepID=A0A840PYS2_9PSEU|nr:TIR domain-containing protein [Saccharopolyspora phatthalungensis]MBB5152917.1 hypothetical protein [Saccharopolyspora phatthalungensis]
MQPFEGPARTGIFVSYRHGDNDYAVELLNSKLDEQFGAQRIFFDARLESGVNYVHAIEYGLQSCAVLLAVIGEKWLGVADRQGRRRLEDPADVVVREIGTALGNGVRVIPVLIDGATMPKSSQLPTALRELAHLNAYELGARESDRAELVVRLESYLGALEMRPPEPVQPEPTDVDQPEPDRSEAAGRDPYDLVHDLVQECIVPPGVRERELPLIRLLGARGSGKTELLGRLARDCGDSVPHASVDFDDDRTTTLRGAVIELATQLGRRYPKFGQVQFRYLMLCVLAAGSGFGARTALSKLRNAVLNADPPGYSRSTFDAVVDTLQESGAMLNWSGILADALLHGSERTYWRRRLRTLTAVQEFTGAPTDPWAEGNAVGSREFDAVFLAAFLADLRQAYADGRHRSDRTMNCVALLDNVDAPLGERFLNLLLDLRQSLPPDPLVVLAASSQWQPALVIRDVPGRPSLAAWAQRRNATRDRDSWWYPIDL